MTNWIIPLIAIIIAYLLGSLSSAIIVSKLFKLPDPRLEGSKNPGATNVLRLSTKKMAVLVLIGDVVKGVVAVLIARLLGLTDGLLALTALVAVIGHVFPIFFDFKGGKGVATAFGAILALSWPLALISLITWLVVAKIYHYSSLAALCATAVCPIAALLFLPSAFIALLLMALLIFWTHRENIQRLREGRESKINF